MNPDPLAGRSLVTHLGLSAGDANTFYGDYRGFPIGLEFLASHGSFGVLIHVRHPLDEHSLPKREYEFGESMGGLIAQGAAAVSVEPTIAWVTLYDVSKLLPEGAVPTLLDSVLNEFAQAGLGDGNLCHVCRKNPVESVTYHKGRVGRICPVCLDTRVQSRLTEAKAQQPAPAGWFAFATLVTLLGTIAWAGICIGYEYLLRWGLPVKALLIALVLAAAGFVGVPIGFLFRKGSRAGSRTPMIVATVCACVAILFGELLFGAWVFYRAGFGFELGGGWFLFMYHVRQGNLLYLGMKLIGAISAVVAANRISSPKDSQTTLLN